MYSDRTTSFPSPFGSAKSGALSPSFSLVDTPRGVAAGAGFGGASGDWPDCPKAVTAEAISRSVLNRAFIAA